jgi:hypothetical protein
MKNLENNTKPIVIQTPNFWSEEWLDSAIKELDTCRFTPEQEMHYNMALAKYATIIHENVAKLSKAKAEGITIGEQKGLLLTAKIIKLYTKGFDAMAIAEKLETELETVQAAITEYEVE